MKNFRRDYIKEKIFQNQKKNLRPPKKFFEKFLALLYMKNSRTLNIYYYNGPSEKYINERGVCMEYLDLSVGIHCKKREENDNNPIEYVVSKVGSLPSLYGPIVDNERLLWVDWKDKCRFVVYESGNGRHCLLMMIVDYGYLFKDEKDGGYTIPDAIILGDAEYIVHRGKDYIDPMKFTYILKNCVRVGLYDIWELRECWTWLYEEYEIVSSVIHKGEFEYGGIKKLDIGYLNIDYIGNKIDDINNDIRWDKWKMDVLGSGVGDITNNDNNERMVVDVGYVDRDVKQIGSNGTDGNGGLCGVSEHGCDDTVLETTNDE